MASGTINGSVTQNSDVFSFYIAWSSTVQGSTTAQKAQNNTSLVSATIYIKTTNTSQVFNASGITLTINGQENELTSKAVTFSSNPFVVYQVNNVSVPHTVTGSKSISISASIVSTTSTTNLTPGRCSASGTVTLDTINRASTFYLSPSSSTGSPIICDGENPITATITRYSDSFTHTVVFAFGSASTTKTGVGTSTNYTPPTTWLEQIPNSISGRGKVTVTTKSGSTTIGSNVAYFYLTPRPYTVSCSVSTITGRNLWNGSTFGNSGVAVQGYSSGSYTVSGSSQYYAKINGYSSTINGSTYNTASVTTGIFTSYGSVTASATVTDSRGKPSDTATSPALTVYQYGQPYFNTSTFYRCNQDGTQNASGTFARGTISGGWYTVNNTNSATLTYSVDGGTPVSVSISNGSFNVNTGIVSAEGTTTHTIVYTLQDEIGTATSRASVTKSSSVDAINTLMTFNGNDGITFGSAEPLDGFNVKFDKTVIGGTKIGIGGDPPKTTDQINIGSENINTWMASPKITIGQSTASSININGRKVTIGVGGLLSDSDPQGVFIYGTVYPWSGSTHNLGGWNRRWKSVYVDYINGYGVTEWANLATTSAFTEYNAGSSPRYKSFGATVSIEGVLKPTSSFTSSSTGIAMTEALPSGFRPPFDIVTVCQGSGMNRWTLRLRTDGILYCERYGITDYAVVPDTAWLPFNVTYLV